MVKSPADFQVSELQLRVHAAAAAARAALQSFDPPVRALAIKQLSVDSDLYAVATSMLLERAAPAPLPPVSVAPSGLMTIAEVADRCHVSHAAVSKWLNQRDLRKTKAGRRTLIAEADLQDYLRRSTARSAAA